ncbi:MAG TPA: BON domain-containing protein [Blastocatellia bacterium]|nr:BON domain-containing protein [Blastocatellia bacterium]
MIKRDDRQIEQELIAEFDWDIGAAARGIGVRVDSGLVTLSGTVASYATKLAAQDAAHRIKGVLDVANDIEVMVPSKNTKSDADIARAVRSALEWDALVPDDRITSTISAGFVILGGTVETITERSDAEDAVRRLSGVRGVRNEIIVLPVKIEADDIQSKIEGALERRAAREAERIKVDVEDGKVTLSGRVQSWDERRAIVGLVGHAPGVRRLVDHLVIET